MSVDGYIRVSRVKGREGTSFISPKIQRETIERLTQAHGLVLHEVVEELDVSGRKPIDERELGRLVRKVENGESEGIVCWKVSRFSRDLLDGVQVADRVEKASGRLIAEDYDNRQPMAKAILGFLAGWAEEELEQRRVQWDASQANAVKNGIHIASKVPTGYRRRGDRRLEPHPEYGGAIHELFQRKVAGQGLTALATFLDEVGVVGPYRNRRWTPSAISKILRNPVYLGEARSGKHVNSDAHEPLVSRALWEAAQNNGPGVPSPRNGDGLVLSGLVRCAGCRYIVKPDKMTARNGEKLGLYRCRVHHAAGKCKTPASVLARLLDPYVERQFLAAIGPNGPLAEAMADTAAVDDAARILEDAEHDYEAFRDAAGIAKISAESFAAGLEVRAHRVDDARRALGEVKRQVERMGVLPETSGALLEAWPGLTVAERRSLIAATVDAVMLRPVGRRNVPVAERTLILWRGEAPDGLPRRGRRVPLAPFAWPEADRSPADVRVASA
jgi:site-specific DNA recombinase